MSRKKIVVMNRLVFRQCYISMLLLGLCTLNVLPEEVCKFAYTGFPELLNGTTLTLHEKVVAMGEYVYVGNPSEIFSQGNPVSLIFVIDNSSSNWQHYPPGPTDRWGSRFTVTTALIDSLRRLSPNSEIGVSIYDSDLYFEPGDDQIFSPCPGENNGYIPLLKLNGNFDSDALGQATGYEILKHYLDTMTRFDALSGEFLGLKYKAGGGGTNITAGFNAAKHGMTSAANPKQNHFIIYLSDGVSNGGTDEYIQGEEVPTTFTVFLLGPGMNDTPQQIKTMMQNIKTNDYSTTNPKSDLWSIQTDHETLMKLLMENVIQEIIETINNFNPNTIIVNGNISGSVWDSSGFLFKNMFPLVGKETDFHFEIDYTVYIDSVLENGDTITIDSTDTTHLTDFTVAIEDGAVLPDSVELTCWGRRLEFYHNGTLITEVDENMQELEIRFTEYEVDTLFHYDTVPVEITHTAGAFPDFEHLILSDNGTFFSATFAREVGTPNLDDGTLQHEKTDILVATFRNPFLPLDTLQITIPYGEGAILQVRKGIYFDNSANGHVDSVYLAVSGNKLEENLDAVMNAIELPAYRDFTVEAYEALSGGIGITVTENASVIRTYVTAEDVIEIDSTLLSGEALLISSTVTIIDSMAPVIMTADLQDSALAGARDELTVTFSENVESITREKPFKYYSIADDKTYNGTLSVISQTGASGVFEVLSLDGVSRIMNGDSIRIHWIYDSNVHDGLGNDQENPENIRREINVSVVEKGMKAEWGVYFDNTADGFVDSIFVAVSGKKVEEYVDDLKPLIELPGYRMFTIDDYRYSTGGIAFDVTEGNTTIMTYVTAEDIIRITQDKVFPDGESVVKSEAPAIDSVAPVIIKADFVDSLKETARDELTVIFSENVEAITPDKPFELYNLGNGSEFFAVLRVLGQSANRGVFEVLSIEGASAIENGDSIRIYWIYDANVYDVLDNNQDNKKNRRVEIAVNVIPDKYDLIPEALIYEVDNEYSMPAHFYEIDELDEVLTNTAVGSGMHSGITIITLRPDDTTKVMVDDSLSGSISIYDAVGNPIIVDRKLGFDNKRTRLVYIWDGCNEQGRKVGRASYVAIMPCRFYHRGIYKWDLPAKRVIVGVKKIDTN